MTIEAIAAITGNTAISAPEQKVEVQESFSSLVTDSLSQVNDNLQKSEAILQKMAKGEAVSAHEVMLTMSKAKSDVRMVVEVRNKLLEGYQELMRMQV